ncbi:MAG TPA: hypothetical protein ENJ00_09525 [Phycisphaerales bacterium]|nr:hypothetical protein [Phycisphaerales bacterium]
MARQLTESDARIALKDHLGEKAMTARLAHGLLIDAETIIQMLDDPSVVRYPVQIRFDSEPLEPGEFAAPLPLGEHPSAGFCLCIHPFFEQQPEAWPLLIAYHIPSINYGEIVSHEDAEHFGSVLLGLDTETYYQALCELADSIPGSAGCG